MRQAAAEVKGKWYNPDQGGVQDCCTADADVKAIELGLDSPDADDTGTR